MSSGLGPRHRSALNSVKPTCHSLKSMQFDCQAATAMYMAPAVTQTQLGCRFRSEHVQDATHARVEMMRLIPLPNGPGTQP